MSISGFFLDRLKIPFHEKARELNRWREMELEARAFEYNNGSRYLEHTVKK